MSFTNSYSISGELKPPSNGVHLINTESNGCGIFKQLVSVDVQVPGENVSDLQHILQRKTHLSEIKTWQSKALVTCVGTSRKTCSSGLRLASLWMIFCK